MRTEGDVILLEHNVEIAPFSKAVYDCLPPEGDAFAISAEEIKKYEYFYADALTLEASTWLVLIHLAARTLMMRYIATLFLTVTILWVCI